MQAQIELPDILPVLTQIAETLKEISAKLEHEKSYSNWLNATEFCRKYSISRPTLSKRVKQGLIEVCNFGGDVNRYRKKEEK